jgi:phage-related protein (TIGR01555 family)
MSNWLERMWGWLGAGGARQDSAPALPGPVQQRRDSVYSPLSNFGNPAWDKSVTTRPNPYAVPLTEAELRAAYRTDGLARRIVDLRPSRATRKGWTVPDIGLSEDRRLRTWERACVGGQMGGLLGGAIGLMVTEDDVPRSFRADPRRWREQPLNLDRIGVLHALHIFDATEARPVEWEEDLRETGYWMPRIWQIHRGRLSIRVHASRVLHFRGARRLPSETQGGGGWYSNGLPDDSFLQAVWDQISALAVTMQAGAQFAHELRQTILQIGDLSAKQVGDESNLLADRLALMRQTQSSMDVTVLGPDDKFEVRSTPVTGFKELSEGAQQMLSTVLGWPRSMLSGEPPGGLSTDDESGLERERAIVSDYQETDLRQPLEQLYAVVYAQQDGPTKGVTPDEWEVSFTPLDTPTEEEIAALRHQVAQTDAILISSGIVAPEDVTRSRFGEDGWQFELEPVEVPDPIEEAEIEAERMKVLREAGALPGGPAVEGEEDPEADPEEDDEEDDEPPADE